MKTTKIIITLACLILSVSSFAQIRYGVRSEISLNNPTVDVEELSCKVQQPPVLMFGVGGEIMFPVADLAIEGALLYGTEHVNMLFYDDNKKIDLKSRFLDIPVTLKKSFGLGLPVKPVVSAGLFAKIYVSENDRNYDAIADVFNKEKVIAGLIVGAGAEIMNTVTVGVNYRYIFTGNNQRFGNNDEMQKSLITISASAYF